MLSSSPVRAGWILKEGGAPRSESIIEMIASGNHTIIYGFACGSKRLSASLSRLLLVLFLPEQEKYIRPLSKRYTFSQSAKAYSQREAFSPDPFSHARS